MKITKHKVVQIHYELKNKEGQIMDSSQGRDPLAYIQGIGALIPGLEKELEGKEKGDKLIAVIPPEEAYGVHEERKVMEVPRSGFEGDEELTVGLKIQVQFSHGMEVATITDIKEETVTIDLNHELAGETLYFDVEVMEVRDAEAEEIAHGHVHGPGGHHH